MGNNSLRAAAIRAVREHRGAAFALAAVIAAAVIAALLPPLALEKIVDTITEGGAVPVDIAIAYFALLALSAALDAAQNVMITVFGQRITRGLRSAMCAKLKRLPAGYFTENGAGKIASRFAGDADAVDSLFTGGVVGIAADALKLISIIAVVFAKSAGLGVMLLVAAPLLLIMTRRFQRYTLKAQLENRAALARVNDHIPETIRNMRMIRTLYRHRYMERRYDGYIGESYRAVEKSNLCDSVYSPIVILVSTVMIALVMVFSAMGGGMRSFFGMTAGTAVAVIAYVGKVFSPIESIGMELQNIQSAAAGLKRINEFLAEPERETTGAVTAAELVSRPGARISFKNVSFGYEPGIPVLDNLSFTVGEGESVTLAGRTGAGKTTAFRLLLGLYSPNGGSVTVCGAAADSIPDSEKRRVFGCVEQSPALVDGTVAEQITLFDDSITRDDVIRAAKLVGLHDTISALENGYDTPASESLFSRGQLQLLAIARAAAADPPIMLLDEITANLDSDTERRVLDALERASAGRTVLSISHRLYEHTSRGKVIHI